MSEKAERYRDRAEEMRIIADDYKETQTARQLIEVAQDYEQMARSLDAIDETNKRLAKN